MIPTLVPVNGWNENFWNSFLLCYFFRILCVLHMTSSVNSFAHMWGTKPLDKCVYEFIFFNYILAVRNRTNYTKKSNGILGE